jgi:hypothetical protein
MADIKLNIYKSRKMIFLFFLLLVTTYAQTLVNEYSVDSGLNGWNCWDAWDNYMIACGIRPGGTKRYEIWDTEKLSFVGTFARTYADSFVKGYREYYLTGRYYQAVLTKYSILNNSVIQTYTLPYNAVWYCPSRIVHKEKGMDRL